MHLTDKKLNITREYVKCMNYTHADTSAGAYSKNMFDMNLLFNDRLSVIEKILFVGYQNRVMHVIPALSQQPNRTVSFSQVNDFQTSAFKIGTVYNNIVSATGTVCVIAQGIKK